MNRKQVALLAVLALADLVVVGGLGLYVVTHSSHPAATVPLAPSGLTPSPCELALSTELSRGLGPAVVGWNQEQGFLQVTLDLTGDASGDAPQALWAVLDTLATVPANTCPPTKDLIVLITSRSSATGTTTGYVAQVNGAALGAWLRGEITDAALVNAARYRSSGQDAN